MMKMNGERFKMIKMELEYSQPSCRQAHYIIAVIPLTEIVHSGQGKECHNVSHQPDNYAHYTGLP